MPSINLTIPLLNIFYHYIHRRLRYLTMRRLHCHLQYLSPFLLFINTWFNTPLHYLNCYTCYFKMLGLNSCLKHRIPSKNVTIPLLNIFYHYIHRRLRYFTMRRLHCRLQYLSPFISIIILVNILHHFLNYPTCIFKILRFNNNTKYTLRLYSITRIFLNIILWYSVY